MEQWPDPCLVEMWLLDRLLAKDSRSVLVAKVLDNADVMLLVSKYLDIQSLLSLLAVNRKARGVMRLAVVEVRLLKEKIQVMQSSQAKQSAMACRLEMIEQYRSIAPLLRAQALSKVPQPKNAKLKDSNEPAVSQSQKAFQSAPIQPQAASVPSSTPQKILFEQLYQPPEMVLDDQPMMHQPKMIDFLLYKMERAAQLKAAKSAQSEYVNEVAAYPMKSHLEPGVQKFRSLYKWARRQYGITFFRDPNF